MIFTAQRKGTQGFLTWQTLVISSYIHLPPNNPWSNVSFPPSVYTLGGLVIGPPPRLPDRIAWILRTYPHRFYHLQFLI